MEIIDGRAIAQKKSQELKGKLARSGLGPKLGIVTVGTDPATKIYIARKIKLAREVGIEVRTAEKVSDLISWADGIIVQLPYPGAEEEIARIPLAKDVDGLRVSSPFLPATVRGILELVGKRNGVWVVVGQGRLVGKPLADFLEKNNYLVIRCDEFAENLERETLRADVLVVATGVAGLIKADMVKPGVVVVDCGSPGPEVDFVNVKEIAGAITPVPGGVGPMTVVCLLENVAEAAQKRQTGNDSL